MNIETRTFPIYLRMRTGKHWDGQPEQFYLSGFSGDDAHAVLVKELSVDVDVPLDFDPRPKMVKALEAEREELRAKFAKEVTDLNRRIQELTAIECSPVLEAS